VQPDSLPSIGASHVRNLLEARRAGSAFGPLPAVAHTPDSFGQPVGCISLRSVKRKLHRIAAPAGTSSLLDRPIGDHPRSSARRAGAPVSLGGEHRTGSKQAVPDPR
jgi:hypothetical protein